MNSPAGLALDAIGNLFIADLGNAVIRKVDTNGVIVTVAGNGTQGFSGDGGPAKQASLCYPDAVVVDTFGNLFVADTQNNRVRKVDSIGFISTVAGNGNSAYHGDGGPATQAGLNFPSGVAVDASGNLFIADTYHLVIRRVDIDGIITTVAGNGNAGDSGDGGPATQARFGYVGGLTMDCLGNLWIADRLKERIRRVDQNGIIRTIAGNGSQGYLGDGGAATNASLNIPVGMSVDATGNLFIADSGNNVIRKVTAFGPSFAIYDATTNQSGSYDVVVSSPFGSVTSAVATLTVVAPPVIVLNSPVIVGKNLVLGFELAQGSASSFTLLQAPSITGPWTTNATAVLTTNIVSGGYQFALPAPISTEFYQVTSP